MAKFGRDRMPHLGSERPDEGGLKLIEKWITEMDQEVARSSWPALTKTPETMLARPESALVAARAVHSAGPTERTELLAAAAKLPVGPIRDLFEGFLPVEPGGRKLGSSPRPRAILLLPGDAKRGESIFWSAAVNCGKCHKIGERGAAVGPDLSTIARQRTAEDLLTSILEPSRRIEPKFAAYLARTTDGRALTGLLVKRDESEVVLRDGENKEITLAAADIEQMQPARTSLMADGQLAGLTAEQAADLLAYLVSCK
jgi:putative heme-binding domain-containing protein